MNQYNKINTNKINLVTEINFPSKWILIASQPSINPNTIQASLHKIIQKIKNYKKTPHSKKVLQMNG